MSLASERKIGLYGGAFDPPHLAHFSLVKTAIEQYALDELHIIPTGQAWHKTRNLSLAEHRVSMAKKAFESLAKTVIDEREILRGRPSYTIDTLLELKAENPTAQLFLLIGQDQYEAFSSWYRYLDILKIATLLVAVRAYSALEKHKNHIQNSLPISSTIPYLPILMPASAISATAIREKLQNNETVNDLLNPSVSAYIAQHRLYSTS